jgi:hypothetical protein
VRNEHFEAAHAKWVDETIRHIFQAGYGGEVLHAANLILLFVLNHEIRHAVDGHVLLVTRAQDTAYLGESHSRLPGVHPGVRLLCELDADSDAFFTIAFNVLNGRPYFSGTRQFSRQQLFQMFWLGVLLLANTWFLHERDGGRGSSHPPGIDRLLNLGFLPFRLGQRFPELQGDIEDAHANIARLAVDLTRCDARFTAMLGPFSKAGFERYGEVIKIVMGLDVLKVAKKEMELLTFSPKSMTVFR